MNKTFLDWDSNFFGKKIFKLEADQLIDPTDLNYIMKNDAIDLCYVFSKEKQTAIEKAGAVLVDEKTIYAKDVNKNVSEHIKNIKSYNGSLTDQLQKLAFLSGTYSRFRIDKILNLKFNDLYTIWLTRSLKREIAKEVFVFYQEEKIVGFVTFKIDNRICIIGLIAVDENYQGLKVGTKLLQQVEYWCVQNNISSIEVATQGLNRQACVFYEKAGYTVAKVENIYHYTTLNRI